MKKLVCYLVLAMFMFVSTGMSSAALSSGTFVDTRGHWAESEIEAACKQGLMYGTGVNEFGFKVFRPEEKSKPFSTGGGIRARF